MWILDNSGIVTCVWVKVKACANRSAFLFGPPLKLYEVKVQHFCQAIQIVWLCHSHLARQALYRNWEYLCGQENVTRWSHGTSVRKCQPGATHGNPWEVLKKTSPIRAFLKPSVRGRNPFKGTLWCHQTWRKISYTLELYSRGNHRNWRISHCQCATSAPAASEYRINPWCLKGIRPYLSC